MTALALSISGSTVVTHTSMLAQHAERLATLETQLRKASENGIHAIESDVRRTT